MAWSGCDAVINLGVLGRRIFLDRLATTAREIDPAVTPATFDRLKEMLAAFENQFLGHTVDMMTRYGKPIIGVHLLTNAESQTLYRVTPGNHIAVFYETPERAVYALSKMVAYHNHLREGDG